MTEPTTEELAPEVNAELATEAALESRHAHPSDLQYVGVAGVLAVLTGIEVAVYYLKSTNITIGVLLVLMVTKFAMVVAFFMHLRFDSKVLRRLFLGGLTLAVSVYVVFFFMFGVFHM
jgi:cytochrome c oxidase subunit 4